MFLFLNNVHRTYLMLKLLKYYGKLKFHVFESVQWKSCKSSTLVKFYDCHVFLWKQDSYDFYSAKILYSSQNSVQLSLVTILKPFFVQGNSKCKINSTKYTYCSSVFSLCVYSLLFFMCMSNSFSPFHDSDSKCFHVMICLSSLQITTLIIILSDWHLPWDEDDHLHG